MIISFARNPRCIRCKKPERTLRAAMIINPRPWIGFKFRLCLPCADEIVQRADANPNLKLTKKVTRVERLDDR